MILYVLRRILAAVPVLVLVAVAVFSMLELSPGDPAELIAGDSASPAQIQAVREKMRLDEPFFVRAGVWAGSLLQGDLGDSLFSGQPVSNLIMQRIEPSLMMTLVTIVLAVGIGVPMGIWSAARAGSLADRLVMLFSVAGFSIPVFIVGYLLVWLFATQWHLFPAQGYAGLSAGLLPVLHSLFLPALALGAVYMAQIARVTRAAMLELLSEDFIRTARAKGVSRLSILMHHALPNAAIPIVTVIGFGIGSLLGGVVVTETVFNIPGVGRLAADSIMRRDYPVIQGLTLLFAFIYVFVNLLVDISYGLFDPRVRSWSGEKAR